MRPVLTLPRVFLALAAFALTGCAAQGHTSSPWEWGGGIRPAPGLWTVGQGDVTVHPTVGYTYLSFDGGHDGLWELGGQVRVPMGGGSRPFWIGGEAAFAHLRTTTDSESGSSSTSSTNGFSLTGLVGTPVGDNRWNPQAYLGAGISHYGAQGWNIRAGLDLQPDFLWR